MDLEKRALRNASLVGVLFSLLSAARGRRVKRERKPTDEPFRALPSAEPLGRWEEAYRMAAGIGTSTEAYGVVGRLLGKPAGAVASMVPLKVFLEDERFKASYKFIVAYSASQVILSLFPILRKYPLITMMFSTAQLLTWWLLSDTALPRSYQNFLYDQGKIDRARVLKVRCLTFEEKGPQPMTNYMQFVFPKTDGSQFDFDETKRFDWLRGMAAYFLHHMKGTVPFYCKIYALRFAVMAMTGRSNAQVSGRALGLARDILRSSCFLSAYCTQAYISLVFLVKFFGDIKCNPVSLWLSMAFPAFALLLETPAQQRTIANYCATFGLYPILEHFNCYDIVGAATALIAGTGYAKTPLPLYLLWGEDPSVVAAKAKKAAKK